MRPSILRSSLAAVECIRDLGQENLLTAERFRQLTGSLAAHAEQLHLLASSAPRTDLNVSATILTEAVLRLLRRLNHHFGDPALSAAVFEDWLGRLATSFEALQAWLDESGGPLKPGERQSAVAIARFYDRGGVKLTVFDGGRA